MDARLGCVAALLLLSTTSSTYAQRGGAKATSPNFVAVASTPQLAQEVVQTAEQMRRDLAIRWLGRELMQWPSPCPIRVMSAPNRGAGGKTTFTFVNGTVSGWEMEVEGSRERILDSVLPHEITHTVFATYFAPIGKPVPRWADEGASTTVEHVSEKSKHDKFLVEFLTNGRGIAFATMFTLRDYPRDIMPLYAQGYSVASFLIAQGGQNGERRFVQFLEEGMRTEDWVRATENHYEYPTVGKLQSAWNKWVGNGGGAVENYTPIALGLKRRGVASLEQPNSPGGNIQLASGQGNGFGMQAGQMGQGGVSRAFAPPQQLDPPSFATNQTGFYQQQLEQNALSQPANFTPQQGAPLNAASSIRMSDNSLPLYNTNR